MSTTGEVTSLDGGSAEVQVGAFGVRVQRDNLERRARRKQVRLEPTPAVISVGVRDAPGLELDLRGQRVDEALLLLDKYLDDAFLAGLPYVRVIHGKGTGALRLSVRRQLCDHPLVQRHRSGEQGEGGSGVTMVYFDQEQAGP